MADSEIITQFSFAVWDFVDVCKGPKCPIHARCPFATRAGGVQRKKCGVERQYLDAVLGPYTELLRKTRDPFLGQWVGLHIVPLYHQLVKLKKIERSLDTAEVIDKNLNIKIHPVYKEIRSVINAIRTEWNRSGIFRLAKDEGYLGSGVPMIEDGEDMDGDGAYHDRLYGDG
uniref:Uncharacterized protein n=1 Tax=viral metagenome TaxID=1070528 RepID=A0A6M3IMK1_9ZZZZ